jgi:hypothetical protein
MAQIYDDMNGTNIELTGDELGSLLSVTDIGEKLEGLIGYDKLANYSPDIINAFLRYINGNRIQLANLNKERVLLNLPSGGSSVNAKSLIAKP